MAGEPSSFRARVRGVYVLVLFGAAFGFIESAIVFDLRHVAHLTIPPTAYRVLVNLGFVTFISPRGPIIATGPLGRVETIREVCTLVILGAVAWLAARRWPRRLGALLLAFATWDLSYYLWLRLLLGWPSSLLTRDVFFLIPVPWIGPVLTPILVSVGMFVGGVRLFLLPEIAATRRDDR